MNQVKVSERLTELKQLIDRHRVVLFQSLDAKRYQ